MTTATKRVSIAAGLALTACLAVAPTRAFAQDATSPDVHANATPDAFQTSSRARPAPASSTPAFSVYGIGQIGLQQFAASKTFDAVLGSSRGTVYGGGVRIAHRSGFFGEIDATRFAKDGERVFVSDGSVFPLGIPLHVSITPIDFTGGYRFVSRPAPSSRAPARQRPPAFVPYVGGGVGIFRYTESSDFASAGEDVSESFTSYHLRGGVDVSVSRWIQVGVDLRYRWVTNVLDGGAAAEFNEHDLSGAAVALRVSIGR